MHSPCHYDVVDYYRYCYIIHIRLHWDFSLQDHSSNWFFLLFLNEHNSQHALCVINMSQSHTVCFVRADDTSSSLDITCIHVYRLFFKSLLFWLTSLIILGNKTDFVVLFLDILSRSDRQNQHATVYTGMLNLLFLLEWQLQYNPTKIFN